MDNPSDRRDSDHRAADKRPQRERRYRFVARNAHEQLHAAVARAIAAHGYAATTIDEICAEAHISKAAFYEHFANKQEAALSAVESGVDQGMVDCRAAFQSAASWPEAIWDTLCVYTEWCASEPAFARLGLVELLAAGPRAVRLMRSLLDASAIFLEPGYALATVPTPDPSELDAVVAGRVLGLLRAHILSDSPETLPAIVPELVRTVLSPFLGGATANAFVAERQARGSR